MALLSREAKVGIFVMGGIIILSYFTLKVGKVRVGGPGYLIHATFNNVSGLEKDAAVKMAGVPVGRVESLALLKGKARVLLAIDRGVKIPRDSAISIASEGFLGDKLVSIIPGKEQTHFLAPGSEISKSISGANIDDLVKKVTLIADNVKDITESLSQVFGKEEGRKSLKEIVGNLREASSAFKEIMVTNEGALNRIIGRIDKLTSDLGEVAGEGKSDMKAILANLKELTESLKEEAPKIAKKLDNTLGKIERGEGTLGKLVTEEDAYQNLNSALAGINRYIKKTEAIQTYLDYRLEYLTDPSDYKHYASLRIKPTADKSYTIGVVDDPFGKEKTNRTLVTTTQVTPPGSSTTVETISKENKDELKFNLLLGRRFGDFTIRGGVMESTGGLGVAYHTFSDTLKIHMDAYDFGRENNDPHLKIYGNYDIFKNLYFTAGVDDFLNDNNGLRTFFFGFGLSFRDDDLKTLLRSAPPVSP